MAASCTFPHGFYTSVELLFLAGRPEREDVKNMAVSRPRYLEKGLLLSALAVILLSLITISRQYAIVAPEGLRQLDTGWYRVENGIQIPVALPGTVRLTDGEDLVLYYDSLTADDGSRTLLTKGAAYRLQIWLEGTLLHTYNDAGFHRNAQTRSKLYCSVMLSSDPEGEQLRLVYENQGDGLFELQPVYLGTSSAAFRKQLTDDMVTILLVFTMFILSAVAGIISLYLHHLRMQDRRFANIGCFLLLCGLWCIMDSALVQQLSGMSPTVGYLGRCTLMLLPVPMLHFVRNTATMDRFRVLRLCSQLYYWNIIAQLLLDFCGVADLADLLIVTHLLIAATIFLMSTLMVWEYRATENRELRAVLLAFAMLAASALLSILLYWMLDFSHYSIVFQLGILVFISCLMGSLASSMAANLRYKTEASVYKRLSREDRLTGLENRRAYDELLTQLEEDPDRYQNVALLFLDLNHLKETNDRYGHSAGDELIVTAARCVRSAFGGQGSCFRIGGDEFAVIMPDPTDTPEDWSKRLELFLRTYNQMGNYPLSLAWGYSLLRDSEGKQKRFSDWKYEADQAMYRNKQQHRKGGSRTV